MPPVLAYFGVWSGATWKVGAFFFQCIYALTKAVFCESVQQFAVRSKQIFKQIYCTANFRTIFVLIVQQFSVHAIQASLYQHPALIHFIQLIFEVKMAAKFPAAVTEELKSGGWSFERANKGHFIFVRTRNGIVQRINIAGTPKAKNHGGGHLILSQLRRHNEDAEALKPKKYNKK